MKTKVISPEISTKVAYPAIFRYINLATSAHNSLVLVEKQGSAGTHLHGTIYTIGSTWLARKWETDPCFQYVPDVTIRFTA